ncbi:dipeptidyl aminopeptidase/acylaminoacyl peptidase [Microbacterium resistens]|uniref:Dipeptidyl aminopeptidase/acylaminoacyl peptidase n=1 Tax=Microbacterium resistens TaxID=156977 RepID=A0ABU1S768_9MICO|nr:prolyl oligopeptidase family serine peptidase [Microbacterium resistens]MDR6865449.1 dipeptidyl aminopeptidase/acylaminoacyl peptidase [Microbacterium resistens]
MTAPYGSWPSPLSASELASSGARLDGARFVGRETWWGESVPAERGRMGVRRRSADGETADVLPSPWSARSRAHEYGGGSWTASTDGTLLFVDAEDQRIHRLDPDADMPVPLTVPGARYGGLSLQQGRLFAVREDLRPEPHERALVEVPLDGSAAEDDAALRWVVRGESFWAHPALSPDGTRIAFVEWGGTRMPWESALLRISAVDGSASVAVPTRAALQPEWTGEDELLFADDPSGRWNLLRVGVDGLRITADPSPVSPADADTGGGLWVLGQRWYRPLPDDRILAVRTNGSDELVVIGRDGDARPLPIPMDAELSIEDVRVDGEGVHALISGHGTRVTPGIWLVDVDGGTVEAVRGGDAVDAAWFPPARPLTFPGPHGPVHAFDHPPANPETTAPADELPPYVISVHGGPTAHVSGAVALWIAYLTSRGIGVLEVNYGGSTGYGRAYRERLDGQWGVVDVDDVLAAARGLADAGLADPARLAIRGGSAGGWTVLGALVRGGVFAAGIDRYGVADARMLAADTHDFEKHYLDGLIGPLPAAEEIYLERSPLTHSDRIDVPVLILQGADDAVVPPSQSESIRDALAARGIPHEYVLYPGEDHGFRQAETIIDAAKTELGFLGRVFGFVPDPGR